MFFDDRLILRQISQKDIGGLLHSRWMDIVSERIGHIHLCLPTNLHCPLSVSPASGSCWSPVAAGSLGLCNHPAHEKFDRTSEGLAGTLVRMKG